MLLPETGVPSASEVLVVIISPEGRTLAARLPSDCSVEEMKQRAIAHFYPEGEPNNSRYKLVRVEDASTLHDFLTLAQEDVTSHDELLLVERQPEAGVLRDLGAIRAPNPATIASATAQLPAPHASVRQPNLQTLLSTNEITHELKKILISLIEAGARLAASGKNYENALKQLIAALEEPGPPAARVTQVLTPQDLTKKPADQPQSVERIGEQPFRRALYLQMFLDKFRDWRIRIADPPSLESLAALQDLGFSPEDAERALKLTGSNVPAAVCWLNGERSASVFELVDGLPDGVILQSLLKQPQIQRGLLNTRMLVAFISMVRQNGAASLWLNSPHGSPLLSHISRTYHSEKYCLAVNQFSGSPPVDQPSTSGRRSSRSSRGSKER